jgi:predicted kinase
MNMKAIITVGISASGKSTFAKELVGQGWVDVNRDDIRFDLYCGGVRDWSLYKFTKERENQVTFQQEVLVDSASILGYNVVISDTNINDKTRNFWITRLTDAGYEAEVKYFDIDLIEALERDAKRPNGVGYKIITDQYRRYMALRHGANYHKHSNKKKDAVIIDIDGTVASHEGVRTPFEWHKVSLDKPRPHVISFAKAAKEEGFDIIFMSGRDACCMEGTRAWLDKYTGITDSWLFMRSVGDMRKDTVVKKELFMKYVDNNFNIHYAVDDRKCILRLWEFELGLTVVDVGQQHKEF